MTNSRWLSPSTRLTWPVTPKCHDRDPENCEARYPNNRASWFKLTTYRKPYIANPMVMWEMTSRDCERSRSWPKYLCSLISKKNRARQTVGSNRLPMENFILRIHWSRDQCLRVTTNVKVVTRYLWSLISQQPFEINGQFKFTTHRNHILRVQWSRKRQHNMTPHFLKLNISTTMRDRWSIQVDYIWETIYCESNGHVIDDVTRLWKVKVMTPILFNFRDVAVNVWSLICQKPYVQGYSSNWLPKENYILRVQCSHDSIDRRRHVTPKKVMTPKFWE